MTNKPMIIDNVERQKQYVDSQRQKGKGLGVVFADAFLRGMRDLGYKSPAWALSEMVDNSFQAGANSCAIGFGFFEDNLSEAKPDHVVIVDDGNGMIPEMLSYAVRWGGTDREGDRTGFGRYGYGLPSSAVSMAKRYTVYSKVEGGEWHAVTVDIEELALASGDIEATQRLLTPRADEPPEWVDSACSELLASELESGTVIILEDLDRLRKLRGWITRKSLKAKLLTHVGVIYRHWLPDVRILVDNQDAQAVDPLFLMEHGRFFDESHVRAERVEAHTFEVETERGTTGTVTIRASVLPPTFQMANPDDYGIKDGRGTKKNKRFRVMKDFNGLLICRERRQIDCISPPWTKFQNADMNIKIEIDFDPELDEFFGITTAKQQIVLEESMWDRLTGDGNNGGHLRQLVKDLRNRLKEMKAELTAEAEARQAAQEAERASINAMDESSKLKDRSPEPTKQQQRAAQRNLDNEAAKRARKSGKSKEEEKAGLEEETQEGGWQLHFEAIPEGPVYRPRRLGEVKQLIVNTEHPFYSKVFQTAPAVGSALEVLMLVLAERELEANDHVEAFYKAERSRWGDRLRHALDALVSDATMANVASAMEEAEDIMSLGADDLDDDE